MKRKIAVLLAGCLLSMAAVAPSFAESGAAASPRAAGATDVLGSLYTHISENVKAEAPSLQARPVQLTPEQGKELLSAMAEKAVKEHPDRFEAYVFRGSMYYMKGGKGKVLCRSGPCSVPGAGKSPLLRVQGGVLRPGRKG